MIPKETIPEGLEYQDQYWQMALDQIKRKERLMALYRWMGIASAVLLIALVALWQTAGSNGMTIHQGQNSLDGAVAQNLLSNGQNASTSVNSFAIANTTASSSTPYEPTLESRATSNSYGTSTESDFTASAGRNDIETQGGEGDNVVSQSNDQEGLTAVNNSNNSQEVTSAIPDQVVASEGTNSSNDDQEQESAVYNPSADNNPSTEDGVANSHGSELDQKAEAGTLASVFATENTSSETDQQAGDDFGDPLSLSMASEFNNVASPTNSTKSMLEVPNWNVASLTQIKPIQVTALPSPTMEAVLVSATIENNYQYFPISPWSVQLTLGNAFRTEFGSRVNATSLQPVIGLGLEHNFSEKWGILLNPSYSQVSDVLQSFETQSIEFDYIFRRQSTAVNTNKLHLVNLPLSFSRRFGDRHQIRLGAGLNYLLTVNNTLIQSESSSFESNTIGSSSDKGYTQGWEEIGTFGLIGYNFYIRPDMSLGLNYQHGFTDMTQDSWFGEVDNDANSQLQLVLRINFLSR
ncbi:MAG: hypothetical protein AAF193_02770 [Bacteroidota bacterium]